MRGIVGLDEMKIGIGRLSLLCLCLVLAGCGDDDRFKPSTGLSIQEPRPEQMSLPGDIPVRIALPVGADPSSLRVMIDDHDVPVSLDSEFAVASPRVESVGRHRVTVSVLMDSAASLRAETFFETVELHDPDACEVLNDAECLLPYPSSRFLEAADTPTGWRVKLPQLGMPRQRNRALPVEPYNRADGFSPTVQILMHFPGGVDVEGSNAPRLRVDTRAMDARSLDADSPTVLIDVERGERIPHFVEADARAADPARRVLFLRPGVSLTPGHRYIVAARGLKREDGSAVVAEKTFAALRDGRPTSIAAIESRRQSFADIFAQLQRAGVDRRDLLLAFDFVVASDSSLTGDMLSMRDQAYAWFEERQAMAAPSFTVTQVEEHDCTQPGVVTWRNIDGTFEVPLFLSDDPEAEPNTLGKLLYGADGRPSANGITRPLFSLRIPCSVLEAGGTPKPSLLLGHGMFLSGRGYVRGLGGTDWILAGTDWRGLAERDIDRAGDVTRSFVGRVLLQLANFPALPDRLRQGMLNTLVLARMLRRGTFHRHEAFLLPSGEGVLAGTDEEASFLGASLGGIMGSMFGALSPDVDKLAFNVSAFNFSFLLQRATLFAQFEGIFRLSGLADPMQQALLIGLLHELWVRAEGAGYATHLTAGSLPGVNAKRVFLSTSAFDQAVSNQASEIAARTFGLPALLGSKNHDLMAIRDLPGPLDAGWVHYDSATYSPTNAAHLPYIPPLTNQPPREDHCDPHYSHGSIPAARAQLFDFLRPGGRIENRCEGICDGGTARERTSGALSMCVPDGSPVDISQLR